MQGWLLCPVPLTSVHCSGSDPILHTKEVREERRLIQPGGLCPAWLAPCLPSRLGRGMRKGLEDSVCWGGSSQPDIRPSRMRSASSRAPGSLEILDVGRQLLGHPWAAQGMHPPLAFSCRAGRCLLTLAGPELGGGRQGSREQQAGWQLAGSCFCASLFRMLVSLCFLGWPCTLGLHNPLLLWTGTL